MLFLSVNSSTALHNTTTYIHDNTVLKTKLLISNQDYTSHPFDHKARSLRQEESNYDDDYQPIRINPYFVEENAEHLTDDQQQLLYDEIVPSAIAFWESKLRVIPVASSLFVSRFCSSAFPTYDVDGSKGASVCASVQENQLCIGIPIPEKHFKPIRVCTTCPGNAIDCNGGSCTTMEGSGIPSKDFNLYISAQHTDICSNHPSVLAYAASCQRDQYDRPTFGMVNFCPNQISTDPDERLNLEHTAYHEMH